MLFDEECPNCGMLNEVVVWEDGECNHCGITYFWEDFYEDEDRPADVLLIWN